MARGWESKGVESQKEDAARTGHEPDGRRPKSDEEAKRKGLEMSRKRIARELKEATAASRKTSLEHALKHLDKEIAKLEE